MKLNAVVKFILFLSISSLFVHCKKTNNSDNSSVHLYDETYQGNEEEIDGYAEEIDGYADGTYCAEVDYYYSETGTSSSYTLTVEIENNELTVIHWPNGGWLDSSHFYPPDISDGEASFTSDRGVDYNILIIGNEDECSTSSYVTDEDELIQEKQDQEDYKKERDEEDQYSKKQIKEEEEREAEEEKRNQEEEEIEE